MDKPDKFLTGSHPELGTLWACVDATAVHPVAKVAERRFAAFLTPFHNRTDAEAALIAAGCSLGGARA